MRPPGFTAAVAWAWCVCDPRFTGTSGAVEVEVELLDLYEWHGATYQRVDVVDYDSRTKVAGYTFPYFDDADPDARTDLADLAPLWTVSGGRFECDACDPGFGSKGIHWWSPTDPRGAVDPSATGMTTRMTVRISGSAICGVGGDHWDSPVWNPPIGTTHVGAYDSPWAASCDGQAVDVACGYLP